jgi:Peptidase C39 family
VGEDSRTLRELERDFAYGPKGVSSADLVRTAESLGVSAQGVQFRPTELGYFGNPMILHVNTDHYVAVVGAGTKGLLVFDNRVGLIDCSPHAFAKIYNWNGTAIILGTCSPRLALALYGRWLGILVGFPAAFVVGCTISKMRRGLARTNPDAAGDQKK